MIPYGKKKRGSAKIHPHNECDICGESDPSKARARRETGIDEGIDEHENFDAVSEDISMEEIEDHKNE